MKKYILIVLLCTGCYVNCSNGDGEKIGQITKLQHRGFNCKTWEGEIIRGGLTNGSGGFATTPFDFTIPNDSLANLVRTYMENQTEVRIHYDIRGIGSYCSSENNGHFLTSIIPARK